MYPKFFTITCSLFLISTQFSFAQDKNFKKGLRTHLEQSLLHFEVIKEKKHNREGTVYDAEKYIPSSVTKLFLDYRKKNFYSKSKFYVPKESGQPEKIVKAYEKLILDVLPPNYKSKRAFAYQLKSEIKSSGALIPDYMKTIKAICFYDPSEQKTAPTNHPKIFLISYATNKSPLELYVIAPKNGTSKQYIASNKNKPTKKTYKKTVASNPTSTETASKNKNDVKTKTTETYNISDIAGTYIGYYKSDLFKKEKGRYKLVVGSDYTATLSAEIQGDWMVMRKTNLKKESFSKSPDLRNTLQYSFTSSNDDFGNLLIMVMRNRILERNNGYIFIFINDGVAFEMKREGGNPKYFESVEARPKPKGNNEYVTTASVLNSMSKMIVNEADKEGRKLVKKGSGFFGSNEPYDLPKMSTTKKYQIFVLLESKTATASLCNGTKSTELNLVNDFPAKDKKRNFRMYSAYLGEGTNDKLRICFSDRVEAEVVLLEIK